VLLASPPSILMMPQFMRAFYGVDAIAPFVNPQGTSVAANGAGQTIAIIDSYYDPTIVNDLNYFDTTMSLQYTAPGWPNPLPLDWNAATPSPVPISL